MSIEKRPLSKGFTLVELLVTVAVLGVLATIALVIIDPASRFAQARDAQRKTDLRQVANALDAYFVEFGQYPSPCDCTQVEGGCSSANSSSWHTETLSAVLDVLIAEGYLKQLPVDPSNTGFFSVWQSAGTSYFYVSEDIDLMGSEEAVAGEYYMLGAFLENENDSSTLDNLGISPSDRPDWPNCPFAEDIGFDGRLYLIRSYKCDSDPIGSL
ncbi:prepilin-type N-terminal cleavage/methylation domain-containing protein [Patescibacteria group bacterium]|nr:prepilin-type N-terminal cleavage/methylation domain-containing protein [Patescibacteria group bacterium]MBU1868752.1 prepilin-type N-terminal cleavage/methylation domain-containing protein [Patescibacteria group bacterium]